MECGEDQGSVVRPMECGEVQESVVRPMECGEDQGSVVRLMECRGLQKGSEAYGSWGHPGEGW